MVTKRALADPPAAQRDWFLDITRPIWTKCLGLLEGNHEGAIHKHYERRIYDEIVVAVKEESPFGRETNDFALGYESYLALRFVRGAERAEKGGYDPTSRTAIGFLHHGYGGGKLKGAKALEAQRRGLAFKSDFQVVGHVHDELAVPVDWEEVDPRTLRLLTKRCVTLNAGTFLGRAGYAIRKGYLPSQTGTGHLIFRPWTETRIGSERLTGFSVPRSISTAEV